MTNKEIVDIGLDLTILMTAILDDSSVEHVANTSVTFIKTILNKYPKLKSFIDDRMCSYNTNADDFNANWDREIRWIDFEKKMLN
jgi:hypothetical protein